MKTRKNWLILVFVFCGMLSTYAQSGKYYAGIKAGFGIPSLTTGANSTPLSEDYASRLGFYGGFAAEMQTSKRFGIRAEINYSSQGGKRDGMQALPLPAEMQQLWQMLPGFGVTADDYMYANIKSVAIINYLEIPVMAKYTISLSSKINFYVQAGPYMGFLLNAKNETSGSSSIFVDKNGSIPIDAILQQAQLPVIGAESFDHSENITSDIHRFNIGGQGAVGFALLMDSGRFFIEGGGNYGFLPIQKDDVNGTNNTGAGTVTFGYLFYL
jgi:hypothetical protein